MTNVKWMGLLLFIFIVPFLIIFFCIGFMWRIFIYGFATGMLYSEKFMHEEMYDQEASK